MPTILLLASLNMIGGFPVLKFGDPSIVETSTGKAITFDGIDDGIILSGNPLSNASSFTIEVIFKPEASYPANIEQRFIHIQNSKNENSRILIELRLTNDNKWFLDTFIKSDNSSLTLYAEKFLHPVGDWYHCALVYEKGTMKHFVNGVEEMSGLVNYIPIEEGDTSIGMRMNKVSWFKGTIKIIKMTPAALKPEEFMDFKN